MLPIFSVGAGVLDGPPCRVRIRRGRVRGRGCGFLYFTYKNTQLNSWAFYYSPQSRRRLCWVSASKKCITLPSKVMFILAP